MNSSTIPSTSLPDFGSIRNVPERATSDHNRVDIDVVSTSWQRATHEV
ncbi:hypothetical protein THAOC_12481, partial [Thalassiosira oceanica]